MAKKTVFGLFAILAIVMCGAAGTLFFFLPVAAYRDAAIVDPTWGSPNWEFSLRFRSGNIAELFGFYDDPAGFQMTEGYDSFFPVHSFYLMFIGLCVVVAFSIALLISLASKDKKKVNLFKSIFSIAIFLGASIAVAGTIIMMLWFPQQTSTYIMLETFTMSNMQYSYSTYACLIASGLAAIIGLVSLFIRVKK